MNHRFTQQAIVPVDGDIGEQYGEFALDANRVADPTGIDWTRARDLMPQRPGRF